MSDRCVVDINVVRTCVIIFFILNIACKNISACFMWRLCVCFVVIVTIVIIIIIIIVIIIIT